MRVIMKIRPAYAMVAVATLMGGLSAVSLPSPAAATAPKEEAASFADLTAEAKEHRVAGRHAEAAQAFAAAYEELNEDEQRGLKGEITIGNAVDDYRRAQEATPKSVGLLFQETSLLERHSQRIGGLPEELRMEFERAKARVEELHREEEEHRAEERLAKEERKVQERLEAERSKEPEARAEPVTEAERSPSHRTADAAILGVGIASVVGGTALVVIGVRNVGQVERRRDELLAELDANGGGTPQMRDELRSEIDGWKDRWRATSMGLAVGGGVLAAAGIGLVTWGTVRMRKNQQRSGQMSVVWPMISARGAGFSLLGRF